MDKMNYLKGRWFAVGSRVYLEQGDGIPICETICDTDGFVERLKSDGVPCEELAKLIAAAPELLENCEAAFRELTGLECYLTTCEQTVIIASIDSLAARMNVVRSQLAAAIDRAKGQ